MRRTEQVVQILIYLFRPEDTTELGAISKGAVDYPGGISCPWLGPLKATLWLAIAVVGPIFTLMFLSWVM